MSEGAERPPRVKVVKNRQGLSLALDHPDRKVGSALLMKALGTTDPDFCNPLLYQLTEATGDGPYESEVELNFMLAVVKGIEPRDQIEAMLAAQMATGHMAAMAVAARLPAGKKSPHHGSP